MEIDAAQLEAHRSALTGHCYRMLGSPYDAEDAVQETMVRAWRNLSRYEGRASLRTWLYRIATNVCLDALSDRSRRARPIEEGPAGTVNDPLVNSLSVTLSRPLFGGLYLEARGSVRGNELAIEGARFSRQTAAIGIRAEL